jgi:hypothetical protein
VAVSVVQTSTFTATAGSTWSGTFGANVTAGNSLVLAVDGYTGTTFTGTTSNPKFAGTSVTGASQLFPDIGTASDGGTIWLLPNVAGGATGYSIDVSGYGSNTNTGIMAYEVAGLGPSPVVDQLVTSTTSASVTTGAITSAPEFVMTLLVQDATYSSGPGAGWTAGPFVSANRNSATWYQVATSAGGTYNAAYSFTSVRYIVAVVTLAPSQAAAPESRMFPQAVKRSAYY